MPTATTNRSPHCCTGGASGEERSPRKRAAGCCVPAGGVPGAVAR
jgi:hypothetical protein